MNYGLRFKYPHTCFIRPIGELYTFISELRVIIKQHIQPALIQGEQQWDKPMSPYHLYLPVALLCV